MGLAWVRDIPPLLLLSENKPFTAVYHKFIDVFKKDGIPNGWYNVSVGVHIGFEYSGYIGILANGNASYQKHGGWASFCLNVICEVTDNTINIAVRVDGNGSDDCGVSYISAIPLKNIS